MIKHQNPIIRQHDITDCAAACLATIAKHYGLKTPLSRIREIAGTDKQGRNAAGVHCHRPPGRCGLKRAFALTFL